MTDRGNNPAQTPIAIVGMSCLFPNAPGLKQYWRLLRRTEDAIREVPATHWSLDDYYDADRTRADHTYCRRGGFLEPVKFDPVSFGIPPTVLEATDTAQLLSLMVARDALDDAGYGADREFDRERAGVILGVTGTQELVIPLGARLGHPHWRRAMIDAGVAPEAANEAVRRMSETYVEWQENSFPGLLGNVVAGRVANRLNLRGANCVVDAACASSLSALHLAALELHAGRADMVLSGGVDALNDIFMFMCFSRTQALSAAGDARPFDASADGTVIGEGVGMLVLKRLSDAQRDGDRIHAILRGVGAASDGRSQSIYAPLASGQALALRDAYRVSDVDPATIELVEAHGTGTKVGDAVEFEGLRSVYGDVRDERQWCAVGSVKAQIGHTKAAAGAASLIKAVLALRNRVIPATAKVDQPHPKLELENSPFYLPQKSRPWFVDGHPRRAGVSSFGFGGSNFHAVLEEAPVEDRLPAWDGSVELIALSAPDEARLRAALEAWRGFAQADHDSDALARRAHASRIEFARRDALRLVMVAPREADLAEIVANAITALDTHGVASAWQTAHAFFGGAEQPGEVAFLFPGQGSQYVEMGRDLLCVFPEAHDAVAAAARTCAVDGQAALTHHVFPTPTFDGDTRREQEKALTRTEVAQPAIGAVSLAMLKTLARFGVRPDMVAGHSFGELTALHAAGVVDEETLTKLAAERGAAMADADNGAGAMLAVHAPIEDVDAALAEPDAPSDITLANRNSPTQAILSGPRAAIEKAAAWLERARGWRSSVLKVSAAFHTAMLEPAQRRFRAALDAVRVDAPKIPVFSNVTGGMYPLDPHAIRDLLARQLTRPVHFMDEVRRLYDAGVRTFVEVGPRNVLTNFVTQTLADLPHRAIALDGSGGARCGVVDLARVLAVLVVVGHAVDLHAWEGPPPPELNYKMAVELVGSNYRSPRKVDAAVAPRRTMPAPAAPDARTMKQDQYSAGNGTRPFVNGSAEALHAPAPPPRAPAASSAAPSSGESGLTESGAIEQGLRAIMALQQQTATAHQTFLTGQARLAETMRALLGLPDQSIEFARAPEAPRMPQTPAAAPPSGSAGQAAAPEVLRAPRTESAPVSRELAPLTAVPIAPASSDTASAASRPPVSEVPAAAPNPVVAAAPSADFLLEVVAELTGYPLEAINLDMDLEADLGIDSIKRLEILSAAQRRAPGLRQVDSAELGALRTLRDIAARLRDVAPTQPPNAANRDHTPPSDAARPPTVAPALAETLLEVVADLTGYPTAAITLEMDLEADLGIDSIKRLEILSAMQKREPRLTAVDSDRLGALRTLRDILREIGATGATDPQELKSPTPRCCDASAAAGDASNGTERVLIEVVAELTGYPVDAIRPEMDLEADLGIDSIKRLEILSATQRRLPALATVDAQALGSLRTLDDIVRHMGASNIPPARAAAPTNGTCVAPVATATTPVQRRAPRLAPLTAASEVALSGKWLVIGDPDELRNAVATALRDRGCEAQMAEFGEQCAPDDGLAGAVLIAPAGDSSATAAQRASQAAFQWAGRLGPGFVDSAGAIFACVSRLGGGFGLDGEMGDLTGAGWPALAKTAAREWAARSRAIDIAFPTTARNGKKAASIAALAERIVSAIAVESSADEIALKPDGTACSVELVDCEAPDARMAFGADDVVIVSGGGRGVTADSAVALAQAALCKFVLLGRSVLSESEPDWLADLQNEAEVKRALFDRMSNGAPAKPADVQRRFRAVMAEREIRHTIGRLRAAGGDAIYLAVDTRDPSAVAEAMATARARFGPITAIVHGAGVIEDAHIVDKLAASFERVFSTKALGAAALLAATRDDPLRAIVFFSSVSARFGNAGQVDYAMANEFLNKLAWRERARRGGARVVSINWGPWDGGMVDATLRAHFKRQGVDLIPLASGAAAFVAELGAGCDGADVEVVIGAGFPHTPRHDAPSAGGNGAARKAVNGAATAPPADLPLVFTRSVSFESDPYLADHRINGAAMMPVAMSVEWLAHAALLHGAGLRLHGLERLRVHRGLDVSAANDVRIYAGRLERDGQAFRCPLELRDADDHLCVSAVADLRDALPAAPLPATPMRGGAYPHDVAQAYRDILFHGRRFQAITAIRAFGDEGIAAELRPAPAPADWLSPAPRAAWITGPLALDAALQLGLLWSHERQGAIGLPTGIAAYRQFAPAIPARDVSVEMRVVEHDDIRLLADVDILDADGSIVARLEGVSWIVNRSGRAVVARQTTSA